MALLLKRRDEVKPDDLPYIEAAYFTAVSVQSERHKTFSRIMNLEEMLHEVDESTGMWGREERQWRRLLELIERYEVVLVGGRSELPLSPVFRWKADETQPEGGSWENASHSHTDRTRVDGLLRAMHASHGGALQAATAVAAAAAAVGAAAVVTEHLRTPAQEKRYTLLVVLAYKAHRLFLNQEAAFQCKLENEFTGPESRRSGPIKASDPAYYDVRRRELPEGGYTLALTRPPCAARKLKALRAKP